MGVSYVSAQDAVYPPIVQKIAQRFNLDEADVQAVFDEERDEHHAEMQAKFIEKLDDMVNDGKITTEQKESILDKHEEMQNKMESLKSLTPGERRVEMKKLHGEMKTWAEDQGLEIPFMAFKFGFGKGFGHGLREGYFTEKLD
jgi:hypothetical protein